MSYNGWQNYETWRAYEWLGDVDWQNFVETELLGEVEDEEITEDKKVEMLAEYLKDYILDVIPLLDDLLTSAISEIDLQKLDIRKWLDRLLDYTHITSVRPVPEKRITGYAIYRRKQVKTNPAL